jgi:hypothetical protein
MTKVLSKAELLSGELLRRELVYIEGLEASVWLREVSGDVIREYRQKIKKYQDADTKDIPDDQAAEMMTYLLANSICDEAGVLQFTEEESKALTVNSLSTLTELLNRALAVSGAKKKDNGEIVSEVTDEIPNGMTSSLENSPMSSESSDTKS